MTARLDLNASHSKRSIVMVRGRNARERGPQPSPCSPCATPTRRRHPEANAEHSSAKGRNDVKERRSRLTASRTLWTGR
jgi:hypothetical protein